MFCTNCGTQLPEGAKYCYLCGQKQLTSSYLSSSVDAFSYQKLVKYDYDEVDTFEVVNTDGGQNNRSAYIIVKKDGKVGVADEFFEHIIVPCYYDSVRIFTKSHDAFTKALINNKYYLYKNDQIILDIGVDDIYIQNRKWERFAIAFKNGGKYGFRMERSLPNPSTGKNSRRSVIYNAEYDDVVIREDIDAVIYRKGSKWGMIGIHNSELPAIFDNIRVERHPAPYDSITSLHNLGSGPERISLIVRYSGIEHKYPEVRGPKPNSRGFDIRQFSQFFYTW